MRKWVRCGDMLHRQLEEERWQKRDILSEAQGRRASEPSPEVRNRMPIAFGCRTSGCAFIIACLLVRWGSSVYVQKNLSCSEVEDDLAGRSIVVVVVLDTMLRSLTILARH